MEELLKMIGKLVSLATVGLAIAGSLLFSSGSGAAELDLGATLPDVSVPDQDGKTIHLAEAGGKGFHRGRISDWPGTNR